ncbi:GNAT family N-acetyltransferase [Paenibacillus tarimensis]|uniref:GNAT family N-acetyltransferase n=1 Tax=Paenibacillus tarimensis TaxID=416012 RepID=UPI001F48A1D3|nr:GNAT family N-acetyltransferase [Paenibacillus tarimensis]MCF2946176.1 GNAT family N-acetyltransferase [Paenibacillus tarimensis]
MVEIRKFRQEEFDTQMELLLYAFQAELTQEEREENRSQFKPEHNWGVFEEGKLKASLSLLPFELYVNGRVFQMGGVASVASWPEERRKGLVAMLLSHTLETMKKEGQTVSCLHPFSFAFYHKYGYEMYCEYKRYVIEAALLPERQPYQGKVERCNGDIPLLDAIYNQYAIRYNGMLKREESWWKEAVFDRKPGHAAVYYRAGGEPAGYMLYAVKDRVFTVHEFVPLDEEARTALWTFIGNHDSMIDRVEMTAPIDDYTPFVVSNPRFKQEIIPYFMARIVDVKPFLEQYSLQAPGKSHEFTIQLSDPYAPWNEGTWTIEISAEGAASVQPCDKKEAHTPDASCDIQTLTAMLLGFKRPSMLSAAGRLSAGEETIKLLELLIPKRTTYLTDFF